MTQLTMFGEPPAPFATRHARRTDPGTSFAAARAAITFTGTHCERIHAALRALGPMTKDEIARRTGLTAVQVDRRLPDLHDDGKAEPTGDVRNSDSGRPERVWRAL